MISEQHAYFGKVRDYFENLTRAMEFRDCEYVERLIARLGEYTYMFDADQQDKFDEAVEWMEDNELWDSVDEYDEPMEPSEHDEWMSYDPDC